jgi:hypothetical protein
VTTTNVSTIQFDLVEPEVVPENLEQIPFYLMENI